MHANGAFFSISLVYFIVVVGVVVFHFVLTHRIQRTYFIVERDKCNELQQRRVYIGHNMLK